MTRELITREQAQARGLTHFFTGRPCKHGHVDERYVSNRTCVECDDAQEAARYARNAASYRRKADERRAAAGGATTYPGDPCPKDPTHGRERYTCDDRCVECTSAQGAASYHRRADERTAAAGGATTYQGDPCPKDPTHGGERYTSTGMCVACVKEYNAAHRQAHPEKAAAIRAKRRAMKEGQRCVCCTDAQLEEVYAVAALCGPTGANVDHIVQLSLGGHHCLKNLRVLTVEQHKQKTRADAKLRADVRQRNRALRSWKVAA